MFELGSVSIFSRFHSSYLRRHCSFVYPWFCFSQDQIVFPDEAVFEKVLRCIEYSFKSDMLSKITLVNYGTSVINIRPLY